MTTTIPTLFISYSHDDENHKDWVLTLATRLMANGVNIILDQWDLALGEDLPSFMEHGLSDARRVLAVCTENYVQKANAGNGGVGYEKMILSAQLMKNLNLNRIIPVVRSGDDDSLVPNFLSSRLYIDFRDGLAFEKNYGELIRDIHGQKIKPKPPLGPNPFSKSEKPSAPIVSFGPERYVAPAMTGEVSFDYSNNNGRFVFGAGDMAFETAWTRCGTGRIYAYNDPPSIRTVALVSDVKEINEITDAAAYDSSSRTRNPFVGEIVVWRNTADYYLATQIVKINVREKNSGSDTVTLKYKIAPNKSTSFTL